MLPVTEQDCEIETFLRDMGVLDRGGGTVEVSVLSDTWPTPASWADRAAARRAWFAVPRMLTLQTISDYRCHDSSTTR